MFKALGVTRRQVSVMVAWQATITMGIAFCSSDFRWVSPSGALWTRFANSVGVVPHPTVPMLTLALVAGALLVANLIAALPGRAIFHPGGVCPEERVMVATHGIRDRATGMSITVTQEQLEGEGLIDDARARSHRPFGCS